MKPKRKTIGIAVLAVSIATAMFFVVSDPSGSKTTNELVTPLQGKAFLLYCGAGVQPVGEALAQAFKVNS